MKILIVDNHDSFTYNLLQMVEQIVGKTNVVVAKNDEIALKKIEDFDKIILSPGPGIPKEAGLLMEIIQEFSTKKPILGVCLGLQAIVEYFGGDLYNLSKIYHGIGTEISILQPSAIIFTNISQNPIVGRYHSWAANTKNFPNQLQITSKDQDGIVMSIQHCCLPIHAVQFHPESILTPQGKQMLENFIFLAE
jgi:anthranilate synthase component 2